MRPLTLGWVFGVEGGWFGSDVVQGNVRGWDEEGVRVFIEYISERCLKGL